MTTPTQATHADRADLDTLDDRRLTEFAARTIGVPRREIYDDAFSFVLHAPLELMARSALLSCVLPKDRHMARRRIGALVEAYSAAGPAMPRPSTEFGSLDDAVATLLKGIDDGDGPTVDAAAAWLGSQTHPDTLARLLAPLFLDRLSAAGHANIYLALLARTQPRGLPEQMLRHPASALALEPHRRLAIPDLTDDHVYMAEQMLDVLGRVESIEAPAVFFIAPIVEHARDRGVLDALTGSGSDQTDAFQNPHVVLRYAAQAMLQGPGEHAPFGWTHALTLAQAPLLVAERTGRWAEASYMAGAYLASHWAGLGKGRVDLHATPPPTNLPIERALHAAPAEAAASAFHADDLWATAARLATSASVNHDAHRVKYTLACIDAVSYDPDGARLYLAAAAYLNAWWNEAGDPTDPLST